ncbi:WXG100 family type VII secretion target [Clostridium sp. SHJSY1]|uniref:WXG100 family type VII secretion target n=1 Tax=Clostridium sp. SHJSY1 TaxID=2942483 RepID=UPI00287521AC|nr:WXG100 family type VII secretion target [Clostridium sp. SHJSY1]MDS0525618.1 WXG100 family type VII secretion target [Clostridium sp. SHJSY1]
MDNRQIRLSPEAMATRAREYRVEADNIGNVIQRMESLLNQLQQEWEGSSSVEFANQFERLKPSFREGQRLVETIAKQLDTISSAHQDLDSGMAGQIRSF